jgi:hypothetical protein
MRSITLSDYRTIAIWLSDSNSFLLSNYRNVEYRIVEFKKLTDYRISDQGLNLSDYLSNMGLRKNYRLPTSAEMVRVLSLLVICRNSFFFTL